MTGFCMRATLALDGLIIQLLFEINASITKKNKEVLNVLTL